MEHAHMDEQEGIVETQKTGASNVNVAWRRLVVCTLTSQ